MGFFFRLLIDEPLQEALGAIVFLLDGLIHQTVDHGGDSFFMSQLKRETVPKPLELVLGRLDVLEDDLFSVVAKIIDEFLGVFKFLLSLLVEPLRKADELFAMIKEKIM